jgi:hypothetical protein
VSFTREYYVCIVFPSRIQNVTRYWGFPACKDAQVGRWCLVGEAGLSLVLSACCLVQAQRSGALTFRRRVSDVEKAVARVEARRGRGEDAGHRRRETRQPSMSNGLIGTAAVLTVQAPERGSIRWSASMGGFYQVYKRP